MITAGCLNQIFQGASASDGFSPIVVVCYSLFLMILCCKLYLLCRLKKSNRSVVKSGNNLINFLHIYNIFEFSVY